MKLIRYLELFIGLLCLVGPIIGCYLAGLIANYYGIRLNEGGCESLIICGIEMKNILYLLGMAPWLLFLTVPIGILYLTCFFIKNLVCNILVFMALNCLLIKLLYF